MSNIFVQINGVPGEASMSGFTGQIECQAMRHVIMLPVVRAAIRVEGTSNHGPIALTHTVDMASPILKQAAMSGANLGMAVITRMRTIAGSSRPTETIRLNNVFVVRVDVETPLEQSTLEPSEDLMETFYLEYGDIQWSQKQFRGDTVAGVVEGGWSVSAQHVV